MKITSIVLLLHAITSFGRAFRTTDHDRFSGARSGVQKIITTTGIAKSATVSGATTMTTRSLEMSTKSSEDDEQYERRSFLQNVVIKSIVLSSVAYGSTTSAAMATETTGVTITTTNDNNNSNNLPKITHKVFMEIRISRADGSFYVRDANPNNADLPDDDPFYGSLVLGLFGESVPEHVRRFLEYVDVKYDVDKPLPSYSRSKFGTLDSGSGLLIGGTIPGLDITTLGGGNVLEYSGRVLPAKLWIEDNENAPSRDAASSRRLSHNAKGLLTHRNLDPTPSFGVTTRTDIASSLDATHTVFGCILEDQNGFLNAVVDIPLLTDTGRVSRTTSEPVSAGGGFGGSPLASSVFTAQRAIFRDAAKTFGDSRLEKVYDGKLLRRIEVTKVAVL